MRSARRAVPMLLLGAVLAGGAVACGSEESPQGGPGTSAPVTSPSASESSPSQTSTPGGTSGQEGPVSLVDAVVVAPERTDPLSTALATAGAEGRTLLLDVVTDVHPTSDPAGGRLVLPGGGADPAGDGLVLQVTPGAVSSPAPGLAHLTGTFTVSSSAEGAYVLDALTAEHDPALRPAGPDDAARCADLDPEAVAAAARQLAEDPAARPALREQWGSSQAVWWALQVGAASPERQQEALDLACSAYAG